MFDTNLIVTLGAVFLSVALLSGSLAYAGIERSSAVRRRMTAHVPPAGTANVLNYEANLIGQAGGNLISDKGLG